MTREQILDLYFLDARARLIDIAAKAKIRWSPLEACETSKEAKPQAKASRTTVAEPAEEEGVVVL